MRKVQPAVLLALCALFAIGSPDAGRRARAQSPSEGAVQGDPKTHALARDIFNELIEINTTDSTGSTTRAAEAMQARLKAAGLPSGDVRVLGPDPRKGNLVARLRGTGSRKPLLLLAHLDVVEARREDWSVDPFTFLERDGHFYGRGTSDDKAMAAIWVTNLLRYLAEGFKPDRDLVVALTADEETGDHNGVDWLLRHHRDVIDAAYCLNEGGGGEIKNGKYLVNEVQASEKVYLSFWLETRNPGGHSSLPVKNNAIYHIAQALARLSQFEFPMKLNEVTRAFFQKMSVVETGQVASDMTALVDAAPDSAAVVRLSQSAFYNAMLRTTCVATRLDGGHADNALPQLARAMVNCRILPGESPEDVQRTLVRVIGDGAIKVTAVAEARPSSPSPLTAEIMQPIERITTQMWPGVTVVPRMSTGATDGLYLRNGRIPTYGVSGIFHDVDDVRAHGKDERIGVKQFYEGQEFLYRLVKAYSSGGASAAR